MMDSTKVMLVAMEERDLDDVLALEKIAFSQPWTRKMFLGELRGNAFAQNLAVRAEKGDDSGLAAGALLGYIMFWVVFEEVHFMNLAVHPDARRKGLGSALVRHALSVGAERGAKTALLEVRASSAAALAMYERLGFRRRSLRKGYYDDPREDAVIMTHDINQRGGANMLNEDSAILELVRKESPEFMALEESHHRLEAQLGELTQLHFLTSEEEVLKKRIQFDKLAAKDKMAAIVRHFKQTRSLAAGTSS